MKRINYFSFIVMQCMLFSLVSGQVESLHTNLQLLAESLQDLKQELVKPSQDEAKKSTALTPEEIYKKSFSYVWHPPLTITSVPKFTQSEGHDSVPKIKKDIKVFLGSSEVSAAEKKTDLYKKYKELRGSYKKYQNLIEAAYKKEKELVSTHYVFYHGIPRVFRLNHDLDAAFYTIINQPTQLPEDFIFIRGYSDEAFKLSPLQTWINEKLKKYPVFDNYAPDIQPFLLSVNPSYFGNITRPRSFTFRYFIGGFTAAPPNIGRVLNAVLTPFNLEVERKAFYIGILNELYKTIATKPQNDLLQIFIPRDLVDSYVYLSKPKGIAWDTQIADIKNGFDKTLKRYTKISPVLDVMQNNPEKIADVVDSIEGRILLAGDLVRNPKNGMKIFRYSPLDPEVEKKYLTRINTIAKHLYNEYKAESHS